MGSALICIIVGWYVGDKIGDAGATGGIIDGRVLGPIDGLTVTGFILEIAVVGDSEGEYVSLNNILRTQLFP